MTARSIGIALDFLRLVRGPPGSVSIMLRREIDRTERVLAWLASAYRRTGLRRTRIVVTVGSLGKTTTRSAVHAALGCADRKFGYSNYGSSLYLNQLRIRPRDRHAVLEVGILGRGRMQGYAKTIRPNVVVVTSIKSDHNRSFPTLLDTREEKVRMLRALSGRDHAILNGDDPNVRWMASQTAARIVTFGTDADNDVRATRVTVEADGLDCDVMVGSTPYGVRCGLRGAHMVYPLLAAIAVAHVEGADMAGAIARLGALSPPVSRMQAIALADGVRIFDDSAKGSIESIHAAFDAVARTPAVRRVVVLGEVEDASGDVRALYRDLGVRLAGFADLVVCIGGEKMLTLRAAAKRAGMRQESVLLAKPRTVAAVELLLRDRLQAGDLVLVKGSSAQRLRRVVLALGSRRVSCNVKSCFVKVASCDACPLLDAPDAAFRNRFVRRHVR